MVTTLCATGEPRTYRLVDTYLQSLFFFWKQLFQEREGRDFSHTIFKTSKKSDSRSLMRTEYFSFVHHTTSILEKLSTWCFEHSGDISCSLLVNPSHTDESWEVWNTCLWICTFWMYSLSTLENTDENIIFFVCSSHHKHFGKAQHLVL